MALPAALVPLRHPAYRMLWSAYVITSLGTWLQNTGAGWLMTSLAPRPLLVSLVQAATILPVFLLALPAGALADIVDRRRFLIGTQLWTMATAATLAALTLTGHTTAWSLLGLTFLIGVGFAMTGPAWGAIAPEIVPREDLVAAITLNGIGFNIARAAGPALAGLLVLFGGAGLAFALFAASIVAVLAALIAWHRPAARPTLPREHFLSAIRAGVRFAAYTPALRAAMVRVACFALPAACPWALLPLIVRRTLGLDAGMYGLILGFMGAGAVASGLLLPTLQRRAARLPGVAPNIRGTTMLASSVLAGTGMVLLGTATGWPQAAFGMAVFGTGWVAAFAVSQTAAQLVSPGWVRARALAIYQLSFYGALTLGSLAWGALAGAIGLGETLFAASATMAILAVLTRRFPLDTARPAAATELARAEAAGTAAAPGAMPAPATGTANAPPALPQAPPPAPPKPDAPDAELAPLLAQTRGRVMETMFFHVPATERADFLTIACELRRIRGRTGASAWTLYEDLAHPERWIETWAVDSWTDHLREQDRLSDADRATLVRASAWAGTDPASRPGRFLAVDPLAAAALPWVG